MNRITAALLAAFDAAVAALIGVGVALVPLTILWAVQYETAVDWVIFWRAAAGAWLLGGGADLTVVLDHALALGLGVAGADQPFTITIAPLGFALLAVLLGVRIGRHAAASPHRVVAMTTAIVVYALIAFFVTLATSTAGARIELWQGTLWPSLVFAVGIAFGAGAVSIRDDLDGVPDALARLVDVIVDRIPPHVRAVLGAAFSGGAAAVAILVGAAAVLLGLVVLVNYATAISMYEGLKGDVFGGVALTIAQLAFLPNLVVWAASWLVGPGFSIGTGSSVGPAGTALGPIPSIPVFAAIPHGDLTFAFVGVVVPLIAGFVGTVFVRRRLIAGLAGRPLVRWAALAAVGIALVGGAALGVLAWFSGGAAGPGRLIDVGPDPWLVGLASAAEFAVASALAFASFALGSRGGAAVGATFSARSGGGR